MKPIRSYQRQTIDKLRASLASRRAEAGQTCTAPRHSMLGVCKASRQLAEAVDEEEAKRAEPKRQAVGPLRTTVQPETAAGPELAGKRTWAALLRKSGHPTNAEAAIENPQPVLSVL